MILSGTDDVILSGTGLRAHSGAGLYKTGRIGLGGVSRTKTELVSGLVDKGALGVHSWLEDACSTGNPEPEKAG